MKCNNCQTMPPRCTHTLIVEKPKATTEDNGQTDLSDPDNWTAAWTIRARFITPTRTVFSTASGREVQVGDQIQALSPVVIMTPYTSQGRVPDPSYRLRMGSRIFNITSAFRVNEIGREIQIEAIERKSQ